MCDGGSRMTESGLGGGTVVALFALFLVGLAVFLPGNPITGNAVLEETATCGKLGCLELCEQGDFDSCSESGAICCPTQWESGVCALETECEQIRQYSLYQSLETYQDTVRERPGPVQPDWQRFLLPLFLVIGVIVYFVYKRGDPVK